MQQLKTETLQKNENCVVPDTVLFHHSKDTWCHGLSQGTNVLRFPHKATPIHLERQSKRSTLN